MSVLNKFIKAEDSLIELIANLNDFDSKSHTEDTLQIHSDEITEGQGEGLLFQEHK